MAHNKFSSDNKTNKKKTRVPLGAQDAIITVLQAPNHNFGKDEYVVDMTGHETHYWQGTESDLLGAFRGHALQETDHAILAP